MTGEKKGAGFSLPWFLVGIAALLLLWEEGARVFGSPLIFPGPLPVLKKLLSLFCDQRFLLSLVKTFLRVTGGVALSVPLGIAIGIAGGLDRRAGAFFKPLFTVVSATPVMAVILIAFLILGTDRTPLFTAFLMVFPVMAANTIAGINSVNPKLIELFAVYHLSRRERLSSLYLPAIAPFILGGLRSSLSLCWKVVVAAEVLVQPILALGTGMQRARSQLETAELFAWTAGTVLAAALSQLLLSLVLKLFERRRKR
jgi:NitT/TauT family transport system permease protein